MSIHIILGKPGAGKSLYAVSRLIDELANGNRNIVTNLPLNPGRLNEYLQKQYPDRDCRMIQRLRIMTDDEMGKFWTFRGPGEEQTQQAGYLALGEAPNGVAYFLDEAHIAFNARDWATLGRGALHYLSQHRKLGDVVWPITQALGNLDKQFRSVAEDYTVLRNEYNIRLGPFRGAGRFKRRSYYSEPSPNAQPYETVTFTLDKEGIASCYDTAKGIGVHGTKADIGKRAKGIPIWMVFPAFAAAAWLLMVGVPKLLNKAVAGPVEKQMSESPTDPSQDETAPLPPGLPRSIYQSPPPLLAPNKTINTPVTVVGVTRMGRRITVNLSDGRTFIETDPELARVDRHAVFLKDGTRFEYARPKASPGDERLQQRPERTATPTGRPGSAGDDLPDSFSGSRTKETPREDSRTGWGEWADTSPSAEKEPFEPLPGFRGR